MTSNGPCLSITYDDRSGSLLINVFNCLFPIPVADILKAVSSDQRYFDSYIKESQGTVVYPREDLDILRYKLIAGMDLKGKTVMDLGGFDGRYGKAALDNGAERVICLDNHQYEHYYKDPPVHLDGVEYVQEDIMNWTEPVDIILNFNVFYHIKNVMSFLDKCRSLCKEEMLLMSVFQYVDGPYIRIFDPKEFNGEDETVYWGYSVDAFLKLFSRTGWKSQLEAVFLDRALFRCSPDTNWKDRHEST